MSTKELDKALLELSPIQREAVEWDDGPLLVMAGPGSGKTRVLTCYIASILYNTRDENFRILGLTFTNKAADEMRNRVANLVPGLEGRLFLGTFHSFCADVLRQHGTHLGINPNFNIYSQDSDLQAVLDDAVNDSKKVSNAVSDLDKKTLPVIKRLKSLLVRPNQCRDIIRNPDMAERISIVYPAYEEALSKKNALDFYSLILKAYQLFAEFPAFAKRYRTVYPYICIDEFQDTNHAQYELIKALAGQQHRNLFIVADDDQIIYQWNGASHKRIEEFNDDYSPTVIQLPINYRCPPEIVVLANNLIKYNFLRSKGKKPLQASRPSLGQDTIRLLGEFDSFEDEVANIADDIKKLHADNLSSVVILARSRKLLEGAKAALQKIKLNAVISQRKNEFESTPFIWLHSILRLANDRQDNNSLEAICGSFNQLTGVVVDSGEVIVEANTTNHDFLRNWINFVKKSKLNKPTKNIMENVSLYLGESSDFQKLIESSLSWFDELIKQNNADTNNEVFALYEEEKSVWLDLMREITTSLGENITLEAFLQELQMHSKESMPKPNTVVLMTIHGAKGKEFDHVYLIGLVEDEMPSFQSKKKGDRSPELEEERRNCFVAITRAMNTLTLSYADSYRGWSKVPSRFLYEMGILN